MNDLTGGNPATQNLSASAVTSAGSAAAGGAARLPQSGCIAVAEDAIPHAAAIAIADMLDHGLHVRAGQKVLLVAHLDGLYGSDNLVDRDAIHWIRQALEARGAIPEVLWVETQSRMFEWEFPEVIRAAMERNDRAIFHSFDLVVEEILEFRKFIRGNRKTPTAPGINTTMVRNFATTASLLSTAWAQTPYELVSEIRHQAGVRLQDGIGARWELTDPLGTHLTGTLLPPPVFKYDEWREQGAITPWPEWVVPPIAVGEASGTFIFDRTLSWWSRYIGIPPFFERPVQLAIRQGKIVAIEGGHEADALRGFLKELEGRTGGGVYDFDVMHFGVHPQAHVAPQQCPNVLHRRMVEHGHSSNLHAHVGSPKSTPAFPYMVHITADIRYPTFRIGDTLIHDNGHLMALDDPAVVAVAARYPERPGLGSEPFHG